VRDDDLMLAGEFGAASRLSPKALRLYAEQGLLVPASTDPATGYRYYHRDQVARARLIARLRTLNLPLARIAMLLELPAESRQVELRAWLAAQEANLRSRREIVDSLSRGDDDDLGPVRTRQVPEHKFLYREQRLYVESLEDFTVESEDRIRTRLVAVVAAVVARSTLSPSSCPTPATASSMSDSTLPDRITAFATASSASAEPSPSTSTATER